MIRAINICSFQKSATNQWEWFMWQYWLAYTSCFDCFLGLIWTDDNCQWGKKKKRDFWVIWSYIIFLIFHLSWEGCPTLILNLRHYRVIKIFNPTTLSLITIWRMIMFVYTYHKKVVTLRFVILSVQIIVFSTVDEYNFCSVKKSRRLIATWLWSGKPLLIMIKKTDNNANDDDADNAEQSEGEEFEH